MLTFFTIPKAFTGHIGVIQRNAIKSWTMLWPACEIILLGDDDGTAEAAHEFGVKHIAQIGRNDSGTPLVSEMFKAAERDASHNRLCFINADIMLNRDFLDAVGEVSAQFKEYLMVGRRRDVAITEPWNFAAATWDSDLRSYTVRHGKLRGEHAVDYFVFPKGLYDEMPPFAVGRPCYDSWIIYKAVKEGYPVVDATERVVATHQNHGHGHMGIEGEAYTLQEALQLGECEVNYRLLGGEFRRLGVTDASHELTVAGECRRKYLWWRMAILRKQIQRKIVSEVLNRTRTVRHRFGLRASNLRRLRLVIGGKQANDIG